MEGMAEHFKHTLQPSVTLNGLLSCALSSYHLWQPSRCVNNYAAVFLSICIIIIMISLCVTGQCDWSQCQDSEGVPGEELLSRGSQQQRWHHHSRHQGLVGSCTVRVEVHGVSRHGEGEAPRGIASH